jgi:hypothetical protein
MSGGNLMRISCYLRDEKDIRHTYLQIRDSFSLLRSGIAELGENINLKKMDANYDKMSIDNAESVEYCYRDCQIVIESLQKLINFSHDVMNVDIDIRKLPLSTASFTKKVFLIYFSSLLGISVKELRYMLYDDTHEKHFRLEYFGGRVEVFDFKLNRNMNINDFHSAYGYCMTKEMPMPPYKHRHMGETEETGGSCYDFYAEIGGYPTEEGGMPVMGYDCEIDETNMKIPIFPERINNSVYYRACVKHRFLFACEYDYAIKLGIPVKRLEIWFCKEWKPVFKSYIDKCYNERSETTDEAYKYFYKHCITDFYGKLAEKSTRNKIEIVSGIEVYIEKDKHRDSEGKYIGEVEFTKIENSDCNMRSQKVEMKVDSNIILACYITCLQRLRLHEVVVESNAIYCDTDSIITNKKMKNGDGLGELGLEAENCSVLCLGQKEYFVSEPALKSKKNGIKFKGITVKTKFEIVISEQIDNFLDLYLNRAKQVRLAGIKECIRRSIDFGTMLLIYKQKRRFYDKRKIGPDMSTSPLRIGDDPDEVSKNNEFMILKQIQTLLLDLDQNPKILKMSQKCEEKIESIQDINVKEKFSFKLEHKVQKPGTQIRNILKRSAESKYFERLREMLANQGIDTQITTSENFEQLYAQCVKLEANIIE